MKYIALIIIICISLSGYAQTIDGGNGHSIMICPDSSVWTVGSNSIGQLGDGTTIGKLTPIKVNGLTDVISVQSGASHSLALKSDGTVWSWGNNTSGQLGNSTTNPSSVPIQVPGLSNIVRISVGRSHNIVTESDSTTWIWGDNQFNQISGASPDKLFPIPRGSNFINIMAGGSYTLELSKDSLVYITINGLTLLGLTGISKIWTGYNHLFCLKSDGTIWAWGDNAYGQLGDSTTISLGSNVATQVLGLTNVISITGGQRHSIALRSDGTVWTWGWNGMGQLGNNTLIDELTPTQVPGLNNVIEVAAGDNHCLVRKSDSTVWGWGSNILGQLGDSTTTNSSVPIQMKLYCGSFVCPAPQVYQGDNISVCEGDSVLIAGTYQTISGVYNDSLTTTQGCDSIIQTTLSVDMCIGINDIKSTEFTIYPNPSTGIVNFQSIQEVQIINTIGEVLQTTTSNQVDLSDYGSGVYFIKSGTIVRKLVIY